VAVGSGDGASVTLVAGVLVGGVAVIAGRVGDGGRVAVDKPSLVGVAGVGVGVAGVSDPSHAARELDTRRSHAVPAITAL